MFAYDVILKRRSIRKFKDININRNFINKILKAGMYAPSARNQQPWEFIITQKREILNEIPKYHPYAQMMKQAVLSILVCCNQNKVKSEGFWIQDCSAATQNILLAAYNFGIGSVWLGVYPREERTNKMKKFFKLPEFITPFSLIALGYSKEDIKQPERFDESLIHNDSY